MFQKVGKIDKFFLEEMNPYSKRRPFKMKTILWVGGGLFVILILGLFWAGADAEKKEKAAVPDYSVHTQGPSTTNSTQAYNPALSGGSFYGGHSLGLTDLKGGGRSYNASQVVKRGSGNDPEAQLPLGFTIQVRLINEIVSGNAGSPVIAEVTDDVINHGIISIPAQTKVYGEASYDDSLKRIQIRFQTLVYPDGDQHQFQGKALMPSGSAGLQGDYHSGEGKKQLGKFISNFVGGLADGMKERRGSMGMSGSFEPGSLTNGALNGISLSAQDEAKTYAEELTHAKPFMTLAPGQSFVIFLEHEYSP